MPFSQLLRQLLRADNLHPLGSIHLALHSLCWFVCRPAFQAQASGRGGKKEKEEKKEKVIKIIVLSAKSGGKSKKTLVKHTEMLAFLKFVYAFDWFY